MGTIIEIQGSKYPIQFGYGALKILGKKWNAPGIQSTIKKIQEIFPEKEGDEMTWEGMEVLSEVIIAGLQNGDKNYDDRFSEEDILNGVVLNPKSVQKISAELVSSFSGNSGNAEPRSKARQVATRKKK